MGYIDTEQVLALAKPQMSSGYGQYLLKIVSLSENCNEYRPHGLPKGLATGTEGL